MSLYATVAIIPDFDLTVSIKKFWNERHDSATEGTVAFLKRPLCELAESGFRKDR